MTDGESGDDTGAFAGERGGVEAAFAGDDEVGGADAGFEVEPVADERATGDEAGGAGHAQAEGDAASRTGAGLHHEGARLVEMCAHFFRDVADGALKLGKILMGQAFLRREDGGGADGAEEGIGDIAGEAEVGQMGPRLAGEAQDGGKTRGCHMGKRGAGGVAEFEADGFESTEAEVVGRAAADAEEDGARAGIGGTGEKLAGAIGGCLPGVAFGGREEMEAAGLGHFEDDEPALGGKLKTDARGGGDFGEIHFAVMRGDGREARAKDAMGVEFAAGGAGEDFGKALAAVGERGLVSVGVGSANGFGGSGAGGGRAESVLEFVEGEEDAHRERMKDGGGRMKHER